MFIKRKEDLYFISFIEQPHQIWYPINLKIPRYGDDYAKSKLFFILYLINSERDCNNDNSNNCSTYKIRYF